MRSRPIWRARSSFLALLAALAGVTASAHAQGGQPGYREVEDNPPSQTHGYRGDVVPAVASDPVVPKGRRLGEGVIPTRPPFSARWGIAVPPGAAAPPDREAASDPPADGDGALSDASPAEPSPNPFRRSDGPTNTAPIDLPGDVALPGDGPPDVPARERLQVEVALPSSPDYSGGGAAGASARVEGTADRPAIEVRPVEPPAVEIPEPNPEPVASEPPASSNEAVPGDEPLKPIPDPQHAGPVEIDPASFNGATPGVTSREKLQTAWGPPKQVAKQGATELHLYTIEPFDRVEVALAQDKVSSIVIRLQQPFPAKTVAEQLELSRVRPVLISNELGEILGQAYPERGVIFAFEPSKEPGKTSMHVVQIILEPIGPEPFLLRAETILDVEPQHALADLDQALKMTPENARAQWLRARVLTALGQPGKALHSAAESVRLDPSNPHHHVTRAQILGQVGQYAEAREAAERALETGETRPHVKARALCLLGDLAGTGPETDYKKAIEYHIESIKTADPLAVSPHPAIRLAAKDVLVDAHLGAAHDIAWGVFKQKETAVPKWLSRASAFADEVMENDGGSDEYRFRVASRALAAYVGTRGELDPGDWAERCLEVGGRLIESARDSARKEQAAWNLGLALYDALQIYQLRTDSAKALKYGELAVRYLEQGGVARQNTMTYGYLMGRVYFRVGVVHAVGEQNHRAAITWFDKAVPLLSKPIPQQALGNLSRHGETFVSMAVSYWEVGQRERARDLTARGVAYMEQAVRDGSADSSILAVPYANLATMHEAMGEESMAEKWAEMAAQIRGTSVQ